jgi:hypothetical protein
MNPNRKSRLGRTNPFLWPPQFVTYYTIGHRVQHRMPKFHTLDEVAKELGTTRQNAHTACLVTLGKFLYRLVKHVGETPDL